MLTHRALQKSKGVKLKQFSKTRARSLEEVRDKLKEYQPADSVSTEEMSSSGQEQELQVSKVDHGLPKTSTNRLVISRGYMERRASFDFDSLTEPFASPPKNS